MPLTFSDRTRDLLIQSVLIVFSVLLALFLDEVRSDYKLERQRDQVVNNVVEELRDNAEALEAVTDYHRESSRKIGAYMDSLEASGARVESPTSQVLFQIVDNGIQPPAQQQTAWESARLSPAFGEIPYEVTYELASLYDLQSKGVETTWRSLAQNLISPDIHRPAEAAPMLRTVQYMFRELGSQGEYLFDRTQETLAFVCATTPVPACATPEASGE